MTVADETLRTEMAKYKFFHSIEVAPGLWTDAVPWAKDMQLNFREATQAVDFAGKRVLDVGCRDGAMLFMAEQRGARELLGVDNDLSKGLVEFLIPHFGSKIKVKQANLFDLEPEDIGQFDIVIAAGLIYHLLYPIYGIRKLSRLLAPGGKLITETAILDALPGMPLLLYTFGAQSPYEGSSPSFFNIEALGNVYTSVGLTKPRVLRQFYRTKYSYSRFFPEFNAPEPDFVIARTITEAELLTRDIHDAHYFEGTHDMHSRGVDR